MTDEKRKPEVDQISGVETTGHEWDGIKELNNPMPRWWLTIFYITIVFSIGYWIAYPAWPTLSGHTQGTMHWTEYKKLAAEQSEIQAKQGVYLDKLHQAGLEQIRNDSELYSFAVAAGAIAFKNNCAQCHGTGAAGGKAYPNLNDDDWLWGGNVTDIYQTIRYGIRSGHDETRLSLMPSFGASGILKSEQIPKVADYVLTLSGHPKTATYEEGKEIFAQNCVSCHGPEGKGDRKFGAPNLTDPIWLYGGDRATIIRTITAGRGGMMPFWTGRLDDDTMRELAIYVHSLGGGE